MNTELLINSVVQQTMVFVARLATAGGVRTPLAQVADKVFVELTRELHAQGVTKKVIADMFGMALRTYHRRVKELQESGTQPGRTLWEVVFEFIRDEGPVSATRVYERFKRDDHELVLGVLSDLVDSALAYRAGRGDTAVYRPAAAADFGEDTAAHHAAIEHLVWLTVYRQGPLSRAEVATSTQLSMATCERALDALEQRGNLTRTSERYSSARFDVPVGQSLGWEVAVLDHYQALVNAIVSKLSTGSRGSRYGEATGGATYSFDVPEGHPLRERVLGLLTATRTKMEQLRAEVDAINQRESRGANDPQDTAEGSRVVFYMGQYVRS